MLLDIEYYVTVEKGDVFLLNSPIVNYPLLNTALYKEKFNLDTV